MRSALKQNRDVRMALWSVYYHALLVQGIRSSMVEMTESALAPLPLGKAIDIVTNATDERAHRRRVRVLTVLGRAGFANAARADRIRSAAEHAGAMHIVSTLDEVRDRIRELATKLAISVHALEVAVPIEFNDLLSLWLKPASSPCPVLDPSSETIYQPFDPVTGRPVTIVIARATVPRSPTQMARLFDPRSWDTCLDHFDTTRVRPKDASGHYPDFGLDTDPIGQPWSPGSAPHLFWERVTIETLAGTNVFENVLRIVNFTVGPTDARLDFTLQEGTSLQFPSMGLALDACATIDEGYMQATSVTGPTAGPWSQVEVMKRVQFVDLTPYFYNPFGYDPGEVLNYMAPTSLTMWLEDETTGGACCPA